MYVRNITPGEAGSTKEGMKIGCKNSERVTAVVWVGLGNHPDHQHSQFSLNCSADQLRTGLWADQPEVKITVLQTFVLAAVIFPPLPIPDLTAFGLSLHVALAHRQIWELALCEGRRELLGTSVNSLIQQAMPVQGSPFFQANEQRRNSRERTEQRFEKCGHLPLPWNESVLLSDPATFMPHPCAQQPGFGECGQSRSNSSMPGLAEGLSSPQQKEENENGLNFSYPLLQGLRNTRISGLSFAAS